jgi:protein TonB
MIGFSDIPALDELAFEGRNKSYGAYYLRKRYYRYLLISVFAGIFIALSGVFSVWAYFYFQPVPIYGGELMYEVDYIPMSLPPDDEFSRLAQSFAKPPREQDLAPVVTDSVPVEREKPVDDPPEELAEDVKLTTDSAAKPGGSGSGEGIGDDTGLATSIDVHPRYPGGDESRLNYLRRNVRYPEPALKGLIQGVVMVVFVVETDGSITNVNVAKKIGGGCDEEAIRVTKEMPRWEPGKRHGRPVRVMVRMPIVFRIPGKPTS